MLFKRNITASLDLPEEFPLEEEPLPGLLGGDSVVSDNGSVSGTVEIPLVFSGSFSGTLDGKEYITPTPIEVQVTSSYSGNLSGSVSFEESGTLKVLSLSSGSIPALSSSNPDDSVYYLFNTLSGPSRQKSKNYSLSLAFGKCYIDESVEKDLYIEFKTKESGSWKLVKSPSITETLNIEKTQDKYNNFFASPDDIAVSSSELKKFTVTFQPVEPGYTNSTFKFKSNKIVDKRPNGAGRYDYVTINCNATGYRKFELDHPLGANIYKNKPISSSFDIGPLYYKEPVSKKIYLLTKPTSLSGATQNVFISSSRPDVLNLPDSVFMTVGQFPLASIDLTSSANQLTYFNSNLELSCSNGSIKIVQLKGNVYRALEFDLPSGALGDKEEPRLEFGNVYEGDQKTITIGLKSTNTAYVGKTYHLTLTTTNPQYTVSPTEIDYTVGDTVNIECSVNRNTLNNLNQFLNITSDYASGEYGNQSIALKSFGKEKVTITYPLEKGGDPVWPAGGPYYSTQDGSDEFEYFYFGQGTNNWSFLGQDWTEVITFGAIGLSGATNTYALISSNPDQFSITPSTFTISPGQQISAIATYSPIKTGQATAIFYVYNILKNRIEYGLRFYTYTFAAKDILGLNIFSSSIDFEPTLIGQSTTKQLEISISGSSSRTETLTFLDSSPHFYVSPPSLSITGEGTYLVDVVFQPSGTSGLKNTTLTLSASGGDSRTVTLEGTALYDKLYIDSSSSVLQFPDTRISSSTNLTFTVHAYGASGKTETVVLSDDSNQFSYSPASFSIAGGADKIVTASFTPTGISGPRTGVLTLSASGGDSLILDLSGTALPTALTYLTTGSLTFDLTTINLTSSKTLAITASGETSQEETVVLSSSSDQFAPQASTFIMSGGASQAINIIFSPTGLSGSKSGSLNLSSSAGYTKNIGLTGSARYASLILQGPASIVFPNTQISSSSSASLFITGSGNSAVSETVTVTDNSAQFAFSTGSFNLSGTQIFQLTGSFTPTVPTGSKTGILTLSSSGGNIINIPFTGSALAIPLTYTTANSVSFTSTDINKTSSNTFVITASGDTSFTETLTLSSSNSFYTPLTSSFTINGGQTKTVTIRFSPTGNAGTKTATLALSSSRGYTKNVSLTGTGLAVKASAVLNGITYTAKTAGAAGNNILVTHTTGADYSKPAGIVMFKNYTLDQGEEFPQDPNGSTVGAWIAITSKKPGEAGNIDSIRDTSVQSGGSRNGSSSFVEINTNPSGGINIDIVKGYGSEAIYGVNQYPWRVYNLLIQAGVQSYFNIEYGGPAFNSSSTGWEIVGHINTKYAFTPQYGNFTSCPDLSNTTNCYKYYRTFSLRYQTPQVNHSQTYTTYNSVNKWLGMNLGPYSTSEDVGIYLEGGVTDSEPTTLTTNSSTSQIFRINPLETSVTNLVSYINSNSTYVSASGTGAANPAGMVGSVYLSGGAG